MTNLPRLAALGLILAPVLHGTAAHGAELTATTRAAFDRYVLESELRMDDDERRGRFLWPDRLPTAERSRQFEGVKQGAILVERLETRPGDKRIDIPDGLTHHWVGLVFVPGVNVDAVLGLLQDYDRHASIYAPRIARSQTRARNGGTIDFHLRFVMTKMITVVMDSENHAVFSRPSPHRVSGRIVSTQLQEVEDAGLPGERHRPAGRDSGYLWRLHTYWRLVGQDGGTYVQCESISLTRDIPLGLGWVVGPFVASLPRESLEFTLDTTRAALRAR
ncbi:MAG: hypothetical protein AB7H96_02090 [Vicinamibacterales bacterium]